MIDGRQANLFEARQKHNLDTSSILVQVEATKTCPLFRKYNVNDFLLVNFAQFAVSGTAHDHFGVRKDNEEQPLRSRRSRQDLCLAVMSKPLLIAYLNKHLLKGVLAAMKRVLLEALQEKMSKPKAERVVLKGLAVIKRVLLKILQENPCFISDHLGVTGDGDAYQMKSRPRGRAVIINNKNFVGLKKRTGTNLDAKGLNDLFRWLQFQVTQHDDLPVARIRDVTSELAGLDHSAYDCVIVAILSHGKINKIFGTDEKLISVKDIASRFKTNKSLIGKPKLFFLQACRGGKTDHGVTETDGIDGGGDDHAEQIVPMMADFLFSYATVPSFVSYRDSLEGTWYVRSIIDVFRELAKKKHLLDLLTIVNNKVATKVELESDTKKKRKQISSFDSTLTKKLYFRPEN